MTAACLLGLAAGPIAAWLGWSAPSFSRWAASAIGIVIGVAAGWALIVAGATTWVRTHARAPVLMVAAGGAWAISEWPNPVSAPAVVFTVGLVLGAVWPPVLAHAALLWPEGRGQPAVPILVLAMAYGSGLVLLGLIPAVTFGRAAAGCELCPPSLVSVVPDAVAASTATRLGLALQVVWAPTAALILLRRLRHEGMEKRPSTSALRLPVAVVLIAASADALYALPRGFRSNTPMDLAIWSVEAVGLIAVGAVALIGAIRVRRIRRAVARLALDLSSVPPAGELGKALGGFLDDSTLQVLYPVDRHTFVDAAGDLVDLQHDPMRDSTTVLRGGLAVARLIHRPGLARDEGRVADALATARLALENERLQALSKARLRELRTSRAQVVAAADAERRRLERDLHDGSQQRLLGLAIELAIARQRGTLGGPRKTAAEEPTLEGEVRAALADLRRLAHGIYPRSLADDGLGAALEELAEDAPIPIDLLAAPEGRFDPQIEAAAYVVAARGIERPGAKRASVEARRIGDALVVDVISDAEGPFEVVDLEDRVGALDGTVTIRADKDGRTHVRAEIPCVS